MAKPCLQLKQRHRLFGIVELTGDSRPRTMTGDPPTNVLQGHASLATQSRNQSHVEVLLCHVRGTIAEEKLNVFSCSAIKHGGLHRPQSLAQRGDRLAL